jgi:hypothetical protein
MEVKDFPNYLIFRNGSVLSKGCRENGKSPKFLKPMKNKKSGYMYVNLRNKGIRKMSQVHRLVATHYLPNPENKSQVDHINRNIEDNRLCNLRWATPKENMSNLGIMKTNKTGFKWISSKGNGYRFARTGCKSKYSKDLSKLLCYSFFYLLKYSIDK